MATTKTVYLVIPKEKTARIIDTKYSAYYVGGPTDSDEIRMYDDETSGRDNWRVTLTDYKYENERIELPDGSIERGVLGTKMKYSSKIKDSVIEDTLSEYVEIPP